MSRKILIVNDDGILADGLIRLAGTARTFGDVWVVAPETQRSAASHSISLHDAVDVWPVGFPVEGVHAFACSGTPGDCVRIGSQNVMPERPDVVLSGINRGHNVTSDIQYSATAGAAFEAAFQGIPGIALSEGASGSHEVTDHYLPEVLKELSDIIVPAAGPFLLDLDPKIAIPVKLHSDNDAVRVLIFPDRFVSRDFHIPVPMFLLVSLQFLHQFADGNQFRAVSRFHFIISVLPIIPVKRDIVTLVGQPT